METHPSGSDFELYIIGALPAPQAAALEGHVLDCADCAGRLAQEARLEAALYEVGRSLAEAPATATVSDLAARRAEQARRRAHVASRLGAVAIAAAAVAAVIIAPRLQPADHDGRPGLVAQSPGPAPLPVTPVSSTPVEPDDEAQDQLRAACPSHMSLSECRAEARRRGLLVLPRAAAEDFPHYELTGRATVARFSTAGWQR